MLKKEPKTTTEKRKEGEKTAPERRPGAKAVRGRLAATAGGPTTNGGRPRPGGRQDPTSQLNERPEAREGR